MQWTSGANAGFTTGTPWLRVNPNCAEINAEEQVGRPGSVFEAYRRLIRLRREHPVLTRGTFELLLPEHGEIFAYERTDGGTRALVVCNFYGNTIPDPLAEREAQGEQLIGSYEDIGISGILRPYEARMILFREV